MLDRIISKIKRMIHFFGTPDIKVFAVQTVSDLTPETIAKLQWLFGDRPKIEQTTLNSNFVGTRAAMITPWSTNDHRFGHGCHHGHLHLCVNFSGGFRGLSDGIIPNQSDENHRIDSAKSLCALCL